MARPLRIHIPNMPYHLVSRGNAKQCIFEDDADHVRFLELLAKTLDRFAISCLSYCLLWNHYHLLVVPGIHSVSRFMHHLNSEYCQAFNRYHGRSGHVIGDRFKGPMIDTDSYLLTALRYIAQNPVKANRAQKPEDWKWGSYRAIAGLDPCPPFLSLKRVWGALDTGDPVAGRERFVTFVSSDTVGDKGIGPQSAIFVGGKQLAQRVDPLLEPHRKNSDFSYAERFAARPPLAEILDVPDNRAAIREAARVAFCDHAYTLKEIGDAIGRPAATVWNWIARARAERTAGASVAGVRSRFSNKEPGEN